jgi:hypothetical protein
MSDVVVVVDLTLEWLLPPPQPAPRMQIPTTATVAAKWRIVRRPHSRGGPPTGHHGALALRRCRSARVSTLPRALAGNAKEFSPILDSAQ